MMIETILKYYWDIFISHTCEFYPLRKDFIDKYKYELDWNSLSRNTLLEWDIEFIYTYEDKFAWSELAWNDSIIWTSEYIEKFKKRLDWYYLSRNRNLPISDDFISKYSKKLFVAENNPLLTDELRTKFNLKIVPAKTQIKQEIIEFNSDNYEEILTNLKLYNNEYDIYSKLILPIIESEGLENIFERKFDYSQRYYVLAPIQNDLNGLTPEFKIEGTNPFEQYREGRGLFELNDNLKLVNGSLQEGPNRLYEVPRFSSFSFYATLLVSENVKQILEKFKLPKHKFHPITLYPKDIVTKTQYYILQLEHDTLTKDLYFESQSYFFTIKSFRTRKYGFVSNKITNYIGFENVKEKLNEEHDRISHNLNLFPNDFLVSSDYDVYTYSALGKIIVNQYVKDALETNFPNQMAFHSAQLLNIKINQNLYNTKANQYLGIQTFSKVNYNISDDVIYYTEKMKRLELNDFPFNFSNLSSDEFTEIQVKLNVVFPDNFKFNYLKKHLKIEGYELLPIDSFYIQNDYANRNPETFKSVVIAENGIGDTLNLILEKESEYKLMNQLYEFLHETGEYEKY